MVHVWENRLAQTHLKIFAELRKKVRTDRLIDTTILYYHKISLGKLSKNIMIIILILLYIVMTLPKLEHYD